MKKLLFMLLCVAVLFAACNEAEVKIENPRTTIEFEGIVNNTVKAGIYARGNAPVYVNGIDITVENLEYNVDDVSGSFMFVKHGSTGGDPISLNGIMVGKTKVTGIGIPTYDPANRILVNLKGINLSEDVVVRGEHYWNQIVKKHPIFSDYEGSTTTTVMLQDNEKVKIPMTPVNGRVNIVVEPVEGFKCIVYGGTDPALVGFGMTSYQESGAQAYEGKSCAMCLNSTEIKTGYTVTGLKMRVETYPGGTVVSTKNGSPYFKLKDVSVVTGKNITHLVKFNGDTELDESIGFEAEFDHIENVYTEDNAE